MVYGIRHSNGKIHYDGLTFFNGAKTKHTCTIAQLDNEALVLKSSGEKSSQPLHAALRFVVLKDWFASLIIRFSASYDKSKDQSRQHSRQRTQKDEYFSNIKVFRRTSNHRDFDESRDTDI